MNKNIKMAIFDIDGTLLGHLKDKIEDSSVQAIHSLKKNGIQVLVATGRSYTFIKAHVKEVLNSDYYVTINGSCLLDHQAHIIIDHPLLAEDVEELSNLSKQLGCSMALKTSKEMIVYHDYPHFLEHYGKSFDAKKLLIDNSDTQDYHRRVESAKGIFIIGSVDEIAEHIKKHPRLKAERLNAQSLDVFSKTIDKTHGIQEVLDIAQITWDEVIAFGDANNDIEMIQKAGLGIAMGNGTDQLKAVADDITLACDAGGIAAALKKHGLI